MQREHTRLTDVAGELVITDPDQLHIQAIDTGEPLRFAWRVYAPGGQAIVFHFGSSGQPLGSSTHQDPEPHESFASVCFTEQRPPGQAGVYCFFENTSDFCSLAPPGMFEFLRDHWNELEIEQLGAREVARVKPGDSATMLRVKLSPSLMQKAREKNLATPTSDGPTPTCFECRLELRP
ncbi:MAG: hypothetical protein ACTHK7_06545 [Aureliella sp.]